MFFLLLGKKKLVWICEICVKIAALACRKPLLASDTSNSPGLLFSMSLWGAYGRATLQVTCSGFDPTSAVLSLLPLQPLSDSDWLSVIYRTEGEEDRTSELVFLFGDLRAAPLRVGTSTVWSLLWALSLTEGRFVVRERGWVAGV